MHALLTILLPSLSVFFSIAIFMFLYHCQGTGSIRSVGGDSVRTFATTSTVTSASTVIDSDAFGDKAIRRGFLQKVYAILMCQLLVTGGDEFELTVKKKYFPWIITKHLEAELL